ncbi:MAG: hypothetical protein ACTS3F_13860 [Phycisphaerales bacterium]
MLKIHDGQCGLCSHFGENSGDQNKIVQLRVKGQLDPSHIDEAIQPCGLPENAARNLKVTPIGSCAGYAPAKRAG